MWIQLELDLSSHEFSYDSIEESSMEQFKNLIIAQYEAALRTLYNCIENCPDSIWNGPAVNHTFNQSAFHTLFFADVYTGKNLEALKQQDFHLEHVEIFADYEELEDRKPQASYEKPFILAYAEHFLNKMRKVVASESEQTLNSKADFRWLDLSRAELHVYNIRHLQHHAAQLIMRLRLDTDIDIGWQKTGWN